MNKSLFTIMFSILFVSLTGCSALKEKAANASTERAAKFSNEELCEHFKEDTNIYYMEANKVEVKKRDLTCN
ncbi:MULTISPECIES: hypothetical protein [Vibrio]|uniref:Lipoprotein n=2 Tax=Vibrio harveyi group TaxID=717610 RepID=A0AAW3IQK3_VIBPH|nr:MULTISPECIES: hypothetical protein [Vibrio]MCR9608655.1 hypothetical protein [Vibrio alginolyticus]ALR16068.1 hypothetical protein PN96_08720 [Vibrio natriegens NBRC 15636 = ATCC 14048 = DSM 759]ANQ12071.1 hypothetical protein BA890_04630 [Vibrio natriegens NBRC 15636 = ATCC 14048 = DSM 759]AVF92354.1 hypothetical protein AL552_00490 [Vibrio diabolicus]EGQ7663317.1 hypothetical protein [Vibrio parahaemolyticus]